MKAFQIAWALGIILLVASGCSGSDEEAATLPTTNNDSTQTVTDTTTDDIIVVEETAVPTPTAILTAETTATETTDAQTPRTLVLPQTYTYQGVSLQYNNDLATTITGETIAARAGVYGFGVDGPPLFYNGVPDFLRLTFSNDLGSVRPTLVVVQPIRDETNALYNTYTEWDIERFNQLEQQLREQPAPASLTINNQPLAQAGYLAFQNGMGLRQVSHIPGSMGLVDINNSNVFYTYEGVTANGRYFIWLQFPVKATVLSDEPMALEDLENLYNSESGYNTYFNNKMEQLDALPATDFTPSLDTLDQMVQTLFIPDDASTITSLPLNDPDCLNEATFVADVTIPDGSSVAARETFVKTWRLRNSGTCNWTAAYDLIPDGSSSIEYVYEERPFGAIAPGEEVDVSVKLIAPALAGSYRADWQLFEPYDITGNNFPEPFGPRIFVEIVVPESGQPDPPPQGEWQIYSYAFGPVTAVTEDEANAQVGKILTLAPDSISFAAQSCGGVNYSSRYVNPTDYLAQTYNAPLETLYISNENVDVIETGCNITGLSTLIRLSTQHNETLVFNQDGVFYFLYQQ